MRWNATDYLDYMTCRRAQRPMFVELFGPLVGLEEEWRAQGAAPDELDLTAFDFDHVEFVHCGGHCGLLGGPGIGTPRTFGHRTFPPRRRIIGWFDAPCRSA